ncbi:MAG TPA: helix-turn-helix domain-containing protein [Amycolatopsis sp.]|uniref:TetR/AcrR family transcriptional regulator n=1 Tax=Amycolatopsis sp. TaxID=37632 RepID=UPI002B484D09|nr:helix-turn-helix domain-containing protein [Amycolatopsis sp.]HKS49613.1 helix-turn-helix domain-containing protein [Amycolatopsis sp.]
MARLTRAEMQECNRAKVLAAARDEFAERGFREAKIDAIAERAELTRGAVYSNFPGKRALYFAVLADLAERAPGAPHPERGRSVRDALGAFARAWVARLPVSERDRLGRDVIPEILADERVRRPFTQLMKLDALLLALALEHLEPPETPAGAPPGRLVRLARTVLTTLHGASQLAAAAPGFVEPFDVVSACEQLAGLAFNDFWAPPAAVPPVQPVGRPWAPPREIDMARAEFARPGHDGVVAVLGLHRLAAVEQAVRAGAEVTAVLVTSDPGEFAPLARLAVAEFFGCLRQAVPPSAWPRVQIVCDSSGAFSAAAGVLAVSDETEAAVRVEGGHVVARAEGQGACHAVAAGLHTNSR